jgi:hypothetical protein
MRLRALELIDRLDEREHARKRSEVPTVTHEGYSDEQLTRLVELADEYLFESLPVYQRRVEARARELAAEQAERHRAQFAEVEAAERPSHGMRGPAEGNRSEEEPEPQAEPQAAPETHFLDEAALRIIASDDEPPPSMLRQWRIARRNQY